MIPIAYLPNKKGGRSFIFTQDMPVTLSDGRNIVIEKGFITDLSSIPKWLWSVIRPFDAALLGDIVHDWLWVNQLSEIEHFGGSYAARLFADKERLKIRTKLAPNLKFKNHLTHVVVRLLGSFFYSRMLKIPN